MTLQISDGQTTFSLNSDFFCLHHLSIVNNVDERTSAEVLFSVVRFIMERDVDFQNKFQLRLTTNCIENVISLLIKELKETSPLCCRLGDSMFEQFVLLFYKPKLAM